jgi:hypothetical protein
MADENYIDPEDTGSTRTGISIGRTSRTQTANRDLIREALRVGMRRALNQIQQMCRITSKTRASSVPSPLSLTFCH